MPVQLPDLTGQDLAAARAALAQRGLVANVVRISEPGAKPNTVVMQVPGGPTEAVAGDVVWLRVAQAGGAAPSTGNGVTVEMPALTGADALTASKEIVRRGLLPHPWYVSRSGHGDWQVIAQKDPAGTAVPRGGVVHYRVALPGHRNGPIAMPYLYGLSAKQAVEVLQGLGLPTQGRILNANGRVTLQRPPAGAPIPWRTPVIVTIGKVTDPAKAAAAPLVEMVPADTPIPPIAPKGAAKKDSDGNVIDDVGKFFENLFD